MSTAKACPWCALSSQFRNFVAGFMLGASICYVAVTFNPDLDNQEPRHKRGHSTFKTEGLKLPTLEVPNSIKTDGGK